MQSLRQCCYINAGGMVDLNISIIITKYTVKRVFPQRYLNIKVLPDDLELCVMQFESYVQRKMQLKHYQKTACLFRHNL